VVPSEGSQPCGVLKAEFVAISCVGWAFAATQVNRADAVPGRFKQILRLYNRRFRGCFDSGGGPDIYIWK
jgi:hypothetical protein